MDISSKILVVEDDVAMGMGLRDNLEAEGYTVQIATGAREARKKIKLEMPDLLLLDLMLTDGDGISLCRTLRSQGFKAPIIMLTARGEEIDKVLGLEVGADDYVVKPFGLQELLARVRAHLRRAGVISTDSNATTVNIGVAQVNFTGHKLLRNGQARDVSTLELELLYYLYERRGQVLSRDTLLSDVWGQKADIVTRTVDNFIVRLRKHIEPDPTTPQHLITVHGRGYKLLA
ncbi:hypothetical protein TI04_01875 [Achromatium sp. WMS2]|nr:hypothetical protein TI04_01875 [Achromatium sp. WMS2]